MPKRISQNELDAVMQAIVGFSDGAGVEEIRGALGRRMPRRLALLVEYKRING